MNGKTKVSLGSLLLLTLTIAAEEAKLSNTTESSPVFVTPNYEKFPTTTTTRRAVLSPLRFTFPPPRKTDQQRSQTKQKKTYDVNLITQNIPATYESIVYNPASKEATSSFTWSNFWDTPELVIRDSNQRQQGKNSIITKSSRIEYTPNYHSIQTPLSKIQYQRPSPVTEKLQEEQDEEEVEEEETRQNHENEEIEETEQNEEIAPTYPVNLENDKFHPFEQEDFYGDVLNNIGSIFNDDVNKNSVKELLPQFDEHSFENLQQQDRNDDDDDYPEERENVVENVEEYDQVEDDETKTIEQLPEKRQDVMHQPKKESSLKQSPFPSVKIIKNITEPQQVKKKPALVFSPWLPVASSSSQPPQQYKPWPLTTMRPVKKYSAKRPKKSPTLKMDSPQVYVTPHPPIDSSPNESNIETSIAQKIDTLY